VNTQGSIETSNKMWLNLNVMGPTVKECPWHGDKLIDKIVQDWIEFFIAQ
jgi:hypothetical protein